jgi:hypothetical protein
MRLFVQNGNFPQADLLGVSGSFRYSITAYCSWCAGSGRHDKINASPSLDCDNIIGNCE